MKMNQRAVKWKRQINVHKFLRVAKDPRSVQVKGLYSAALHIPEVEQALEAYQMDGFIYMWRKCKNQSGNNLKTYFVRYKLGTSSSKREYVLSGGRV